jgi:hypothetical protein
MQLIKGEWFLNQAYRGISGAHEGHKLIGFNHDLLRNGKY